MFDNSFLKNVFSSNYLTIILLILGFTLRFYEFDNLGLWGDEILTYWETQPLQTYNEVWLKIKDTEYNSPLYFYILNIYNHYFDYSAYSIRLFHIIFGFLSLVLVFIISRYLFSKSWSNLILFLLSINLFLIWISTEVRIIAFILFFYLLLILFFFQIIKNILNKKISFFEIILLCFFNLFTLSLHPFAIVIISSQLLFLFLIYIHEKENLKKKILFYTFLIILFCIFYGLLNKEYILSRLDGDPLVHHKLSIKFFIGYNFKSFFSSYLLGFINLSFIALYIWKLKENIYKNLFLLFLTIVFICTYLFIIFTSLTFSGVSGARYWTYLVPIIIILNVSYIQNIEKKLISNSIILFLIFFTTFVCVKNFDKPQITKPDTPGLIKFINNSDTDNIISQNLFYFDHYLRTGYQNKLNKKIFYENKISEFDNDFLYICLDLVWIPNNITDTKDTYDCYPKSKNMNKFIKDKTLKFNGYAVTKFRINR